MKVTVVKIQDGKPAGKRQTPTKIFIYNDGREEKSLLLFDPKMVSEIQPGDIVELEVEQNGKYVNAKSITFVAKGAVPASTTPPKSYQEDPKKQENISRAVALDKAVQLVVAFGGKIPLDKAIYEVLVTAPVFFRYLIGEDTPTATTEEFPPIP